MHEAGKRSQVERQHHPELFLLHQGPPTSGAELQGRTLGLVESQSQARQVSLRSSRPDLPSPVPLTHALSSSSERDPVDLKILVGVGSLHAQGFLPTVREGQQAILV